MDGFLPNVIKYLLFATNFLVFLMGCVVLGFGIYALVDGEALSNLVSLGAEELNQDVSITVYSTAAIILIAVSVFVVIVSFFGCCGAIKENKCMLGTYFTVILVTFIVLIVGAVIGYGQALDDIKAPLKKSMEFFDDKGDSTDKKKDTITKAWNQVQLDYDCCGVDSYKDWNITGLFPDPFKVPKSCCEGRADIPDDPTVIATCRTNPGGAKLTGCYTKFEESIKANSDKILYVGVAIVVVMFLNMIFAFALCTMTR